jgi:cellulose synthase/poly-beta-1,6-N-acetylglucosamine synthase-like glycosyltransferase
MNFFDWIKTIITVLFLVVVLSYYVLILIKIKKPKITKHFKSISVIIPAHNEEAYIADAIRSVIAERFEGKKQICS